VSISKRHFWNFFYKIYTRAFTQQNIRAGWAAIGIYLLNFEYVLVRISKRKRKSEVTFSLKTPNLGRAFRRTFGRLQTEGYIDNETAILARGDEKFAAENKILRKEIEGLREAIFKEKRKRKREKVLNFYEESEMEGQIVF
jgi:hypothetical protein